MSEEDTKSEDTKDDETANDVAPPPPPPLESRETAQKAVVEPPKVRTDEETKAAEDRNTVDQIPDYRETHPSLAGRQDTEG